MSIINYSHSGNMHLIDAPSVIFPIINELYRPKNILDVGCGTGTWLKIVSEYGIEDYVGIDGIEVSDEEFLASKEKFKKYDLTNYWNLGKKFDLLLCLEVAEHLPSDLDSIFVQSLTNHSDIIIFSAACPNQPGQGHINCQWIDYWQDLFNKYRYACFDEIRPLIWNKDFPEWWYKQNIFVAKRDEINAGTETKLMSIVHPDLYIETFKSLHKFIEGNASLKTYLEIFLKKIKKKFY
ncbi:class I SAM-dependent methyltransferase [Pseudanabaena yagii]|uniref:Class I SAM-dependent methyltransferase n=1 Tax=Pseudanabaena yagii GIHE-NHR1 TaxID=2722753 RepID=A0ABX1LKK8_9CYAN|nr:methyltransferase domain-containing protein [Pseudanabaena yagii]NMF56642.1 class I SAM-dependent methyltransferase [Pseudanabaena yagii GIHE-NHR1]